MNKLTPYALALLLLLIFTPTAYNMWASRAVVFNSTSQYAKRDALPAGAPWNALTNWELSIRVRQPTQYGHLIQISGSHQLTILSIVGSGRYDVHLLDPDLTVYHTPADINDVVLKVSYSGATDKVTVTSTKGDGTGQVVSQSGALSMASGWNWAGQKLSLNANSYDTSYVGCHVDWLRINSGTTALAAWEFDADSGADSSGNGLALTLVGSPSFEDSPAEANASPPDAAPALLIGQSVAAGKSSLFWKEGATNEQGFKVERKTTAAGVWAEVGTAPANATTYADTTTAGGTEYYYRVRAYNSAGFSDYSNEYRVLTPAAGRVLTTVKVFRSGTRVNRGEETTFTAQAFDQNGVEMAAVVPQWSSADPFILSLLPDADLPLLWKSLSNRVMTARGEKDGTTSVTATIEGVSGTATGVRVLDTSGGLKSPQPAASIEGDVVSGTITARVGEPVYVHARNAVGVEEIDWDWGDGDRTTVGDSATHAYLAPGTYTLRQTVTSKSKTLTPAQAAVTVNVNPHPAATQTYVVTSLAQLLQRYNQCTGGEHIVIAKGTTLTGNILLPERPFTDYVTIRSDGAMPDLRNRISRASPELATIRNNVPGVYTLTVAKRAHHIRFVGLKIDSAVDTYYLVAIGNHFGTHDTVDDQAHHIIFEHCVLDPTDDVLITHGINNDGKRVSVISSYVGNIHTNQGDATGIGTQTGEGIHVYNNDFAEATGEPFITGGTSNAMQVTPEAIEFRRCYFYKSLKWRNNTQGYLVKNLWETKFGRNIYLEGCVFEQSYQGGQYFAIVVKSANDAPGNALEYVKFENCYMVHVDGGFNIAWDWDDNNKTDGYPWLSTKPRHVTFQNFLIHDLSSAWGNPGTATGRAIDVGNIDYARFRNITALTEAGNTGVMFETGNNREFEISDSIIGLGGYAIFKGGDAWGSGGTAGIKSLDEGCGVGRWKVNHNVFGLYSSDGYTDESKFPHESPNLNAYPHSVAEIGLTDPANGNYRLLSTSTFYGQGYGADQNSIEKRTAHTRDGQWGLGKGIVLNGSGQYGSLAALPSAAPYSSVGAFSIKMRVRAVSTYGYLFAISSPDGEHRISALSIPGSGRIDLHDDRESPGLAVYHTPADINDCIIEFSFDPANSRWLVTSHRADGTGLVTTPGSLANASNWNFSGYRLTVGANYYGVVNPTVKIDWFRWATASAQLADYEFDSGDGSDTSGNGQHLILYGLPTSEDSPPEN